MKYDDRVARCYQMLRNPEFTPLLSYIRAKREAKMELLAQATDPNVILRLQGQVTELKDFLDYVANAK